MKKKRLTFLVVLLVAILGFHDSAWGQIGVLAPEYQPNTNPQLVRPAVNSQEDPPRIDLRRANATPGIPGFIDNDVNVNNIFGAGESATIQGSNVIMPGAQRLITGTSNKIVLGGDGSQNIVIRSYTGDGYGIGWISVLRVPAGSDYSTNHVGHTQSTWSKFIFPLAYPTVPGDLKVLTTSNTTIDNTYPIIFIDDARTISAGGQRPNDFVYGTTHPSANNGYDNLSPMIFSFNRWNFASFATWVPQAPCNTDLFTSTIAGNTISVNHHSYTSASTNNFVTFNAAPTPQPVSVYTSTIDGSTSYMPIYQSQNLYPSNIIINQDDGISLTQLNGAPLTNSKSLAEQDKPISVIGRGKSDDVPSSKLYYLDNYTRPTTVAIAKTSDDSPTMLDNIQFNTIGWWASRSVVKEQMVTLTTQGSGARAGVTSGNKMWDCNSGEMTAWGFSVDWLNDTIPGATKLDAAVQLLNGARVCVAASVEDMTGNIATGHQTDDSNYATDYKLTNALIVFPVEDRVTLRTKGNFLANMYHERNSLYQSANAYYKITNFPDPDENIYMYPNAATTPAHDFATPHLGEFRNLTITSKIITAPIDAATSSIFGVYGDYDFAGLMAEIHTTKTHNTVAPFAPIGADNNPGVIEIGPQTEGKEYFHIYSGGVLKNFEGCTSIQNFAMNFGTAFGGFPKLHFDEDEDLSILNYGNNNQAYCDAKIIFNAGSIAALEGEITKATGSGAFRVQALSDVVLNEDAVMDATTVTGGTGGKGNNLYLLSDGGNVITKKMTLTHDYVNTVGQGMIMLWAEDRDDLSFSCANTDANRNGLRGNLYLNDDVSVTRTAGSLDGTETNLIAANNIRTVGFDFVSSNTKNDITNVISRKGDIYLGYGKDDNKKFTYTISNTANAGVLNIKSGYDDQTNTGQLGGGNIYFTQLEATMVKDGTYPTNIMIPFSNEYLCGSGWTTGKLHERSTSNNAMQLYEHAGIIGGIGRCGVDSDWDHYAKVLDGSLSAQITTTAPSLKYTANNGILLLDAGLRGNIIMNQGSVLDFQGNNGEGFFRTRKGDIDMRGQTDVEGLAATKGLVFLADNGNANKKLIDNCNCEEEFNNIYMQDFDFETFATSSTNNGSVYFGADNNIKLQYGGLRDIGTWLDPFLSENKGYDGATCGGYYQCDSRPAENQARPMILDYRGKTNGGGVGIVASDMIDVYKELIYYGGASGIGMSPVPAAPSFSTPNNNAPRDGKLHGESVAGFGLYIKTQGNKSNWTFNPFEVIEACAPECSKILCGIDAPLHQVARVTFHDDARIIAENSKAYIGSPVLEVYGNLELNTTSGTTKTNQLLHIQTDSLIVHDSLILDGDKWRLTTWSKLERNIPVIKLGHQRFTPPMEEEGCALCYSHTKGGNINNRTALDTLVVTFRNFANLPRLHTLVADHTVLTFLADSYDGMVPNLPPVLDAKIFTDTFKIRNQVELWTSADKTHDGHFELVSEIQMSTKNAAGVFARHLHMEPIAPDCSNSKYSELWLPTSTLDVISTSTFGGFGTLYADVYAETVSRIAPGYASLGIKGNCYEQRAGTLKMKDLRMDRGAELHYSIGNVSGFNNEYTDCIDVEHLILRGDIYIFVEKRCNQYYTPGCYPLIRYKSVDDLALNNLKLATTRIDGTTLALDFSEKGVVYLCVGEQARPMVQREVVLPEPPHGVDMFPMPGVHYVPWGNDFSFTLNFFGREEFEVYVDRGDGDPAREIEILTATMNANGEHEYTLRNVKTQPIHIYIGPNSVGNESLDKSAVWSSGNTLYIRVAREDIASIYSVAGTLVNRIEVPEGGITLPLSRGAYIVTLKDGSVHKVIIR